MAHDLNLMFHGTSSSSVTFSGTDTTGTNGPVVDLGSTTAKRTLLLERRISGAVTGTLDIKLMSSSDNSTFVNMPGTTTAALLGFAKATTNSYGSTDTVAPSGPNAVGRAIMQMTPGHRYLRATFTVGTSATSVAGVTVVGKVLGGAFSGQSGPIA